MSYVFTDLEMFGTRLVKVIVLEQNITLGNKTSCVHFVYLQNKVFLKQGFISTDIPSFNFCLPAGQGIFVSKSQRRRIMFRTCVNSVGSNIVGAPSELVVPEHLDPTGPMVVPDTRAILCQISNN